MITYIFLLIYVGMLGFLTYQDTQLRKVMRDAGWRWEIIGILWAFGGLLVALALRYIWHFPAPPSTEQPSWQVLVLATLLNLGPLACLIRSRHLLHKAFDRYFPKRRKPIDKTK